MLYYRLRHSRERRHGHTQQDQSVRRRQPSFCLAEKTYMMIPQRILITGGSGYLGRVLAAKASCTATVYATYHTQADRIAAGHAVSLPLLEREQVLRCLTTLAPHVILHTAAVNPGKGSSQDMWQTNVEGSRYIAEGAAAIGARLVHMSSDVVHDGRQAPYADDAPPTPLNAYGQSKATGEAVVAAILPQAVIVRTSLIYGLTEMDSGTAGFAQRLQEGQPLVLFTDVLRQPIWVETLAEALLKLATLDYAGTLNVAGQQVLTRAAFGQRMLNWWGINTQERVQHRRAAEISETIPLDLRLNITKAEQLLGMAFPGVDEVLTQ
jgi:dTDP-4-dehydrorhamnose reductase